MVSQSSPVRHSAHTIFLTRARRVLSFEAHVIYVSMTEHEQSAELKTVVLPSGTTTVWSSIYWTLRQSVTRTQSQYR